ncbi:MAG TPA: alpha/beta hydrolase [Kofleriaceae bacterium]
MKTIETNGVRFAYLEAGTGPLVVLVHGFPDTAYTWDRALPALAEAGFRAVAPFTRGYFPTSIPADGNYDTDTLGRDVLGLIEALGAKQAVIVGHDWGANAAYAAASMAPERVKLLVTFAIPHPRAIKPTPRMLWTVRHMFALRRKNAAARVRRDNFLHVDELVRRWSPAWKDIPASETEYVKQTFAEPGSLEAALGYYKALRPSLPASLRQPILVPAVAFAGEHDIISPRAYEKARHCFSASYEVVQVPGGHFMHREHADHVIPELVRVIREHAGAA